MSRVVRWQATPTATLEILFLFRYFHIQYFFNSYIFFVSRILPGVSILTRSAFGVSLIRVVYLN